MAADLGSWPAEQATVLLEVLQQSGLHPEAHRKRDGVHVTVPDEEGDKAHTTLVQHMDTIARAARPPAGPRRRPREPRRPGPTTRGPATPAGDRPLSSERLRRLGNPLGILLVGLLISLAVPPLRVIGPVITVAVLVYVLGKQSQRGQD